VGKGRSSGTEDTHDAGSLIVAELDEASDQLSVDDSGRSLNMGLQFLGELKSRSSRLCELFR
jgi:hypothetical protein